MYTILINSDNTLTQSIRENIMHREANIHTFRFLVDPKWVDKGVETDMRNYTCVLEYRTPISEKYTPIILTPSENLYKEKLEYLFPIDLKLTSEVGNVELKFIFTWLEMNSDGTFKEHSRKTSTTAIYIIPVSQWSDYVASSDLDSIVQMILTNQAQGNQIKQYQEQLQAYASVIMATKGDSLSYNSETNELQLQANGESISSVTLEECELEDGVPVVDFENEESTEKPEDETFDNVVEF